jgi:hypothetical protein
MREANITPPSPTPNQTPSPLAPSNKVPSSRKSVHFADVDDVAVESASLLRGPVRGRPKGKLVRPSSMPLPIITKVPPVQKAKPVRKIQLEGEKSQPKKTKGRPDVGDRRSGRARQDVVTYSDKDTARLAAGYTDVASLKKASKSGPATPSASTTTWGKEEGQKLRQAREAGQTWEEIHKVGECRVCYIYY